MNCTTLHWQAGLTTISNEALCRTIPPVLFREGSPATGSESKTETAQDEERILRCRFCDKEITKAANRISRSGNHLHTFFNPAGIVYEIGCFSRAEGCSHYGPHSTDFAWFADHSWQIVHCSFCSEHLGWFFSSAADSFYGLVVNRLVE